MTERLPPQSEYSATNMRTTLDQCIQSRLPLTATAASDVPFKAMDVSCRHLIGDGDFGETLQGRLNFLTDIFRATAPHLRPSAPNP